MSGTEAIDPRNAGLDMWPDETILDALLDGQRRAVSAVETARDALVSAASSIAARLGKTGRIVYAGAGSSGIIAAPDGIGLLGTYGWPAERIALVLASGDRLAPLTGDEEDDEDAARAAIARASPQPERRGDCGGGQRRHSLHRRRRRCRQSRHRAHHRHCQQRRGAAARRDRHPGPPRFGARGDRRLDADGCGHGPESRTKPHFHADNRKLRARAIRTLRHITGCSEEEAAAALKDTGGLIKPAALMLGGVPRVEAERLLAAAGDNLRAALARAASR